MNAAIEKSVLNQTPNLIRAIDSAPETLLTWERFRAFFPPEEKLEEHLPDSFRLSLKSYDTHWQHISTHLVNFTSALSRALASCRRNAPAVRERLLVSVASQSQKNSSTKLNNATGRFLKDITTFVQTHEKESPGQCKFLQSLLVHHFSDAQLEEIQQDQGIPMEERIVFGKTARRTGNKNYRAFFEGQQNNIQRDVLEAEFSRPVVSEAIVKDAVSFIVSNCMMLSWGKKVVPLGNRQTTEIPCLIRKCSMGEMWENYQCKMNQKRYKFVRIVEVSEKLKNEKDMQYQGSLYNVRIEWADDHEDTWEPLHSIALDDPVTCACFGYEYGLLDCRGWKRLKTFVNENTGVAGKMGTLKAFRGGRQMLGRTTFLSIARALTGGNKKIISSVDYVKGVLIHDTVDTLQKIITDHIISKQQQAHLTKLLMLVSNFLKNQYKNHVEREDGWDSHGIKRGLLLSAATKPRHFSVMTVQELDAAIEKRGISFETSRAVSTKKKVLELTRWDYERGAVDVEPLRPPDMKTTLEIGVAHGATAVVVSDYEYDTTTAREITKPCWCDGCAYVHWFMVKYLPDTLCKLLDKEEDAQKKKSLKNALEFIGDAHEKFMLYQAHQVRVVNQTRQLSKYEERLLELCHQQKNDSLQNLWVVVDFKMKWEPLYDREKTVENYGKRGISWHGGHVHGYVWDHARAAPAKIVVKVDQILDGSNKQDGLTVLALLEAMQVYLSQEFPGACIEYLQSDNASAYHLKDLILGIPWLNYVRALGSFVLQYDTAVFSLFLLFLTAAHERYQRTCNKEFCPHRNTRWQEPDRCSLCSCNSICKTIHTKSQ